MNARAARRCEKPHAAASSRACRLQLASSVPRWLLSRLMIALNAVLRAAMIISIAQEQV